MELNKKLPKAALGAWSWGTGAAGGDQVFGNHLTQEELKVIYDLAMENGLNLWDTATVYGMGASEDMLGTFAKDTNRDDIIISTKFTPQIASDKESAMEDMLDASMKRLYTDYIDIYWIHNPMDVEKWTPYLIPLAKSGKIKAIGVSNHNLEEIKTAQAILAKEGLKISAIQNHFSLLNRSSEEAGILDYCKENDMTFFAYMVLEQGALTGKYNPENPFPAGSDRANSYNPYLKELQQLNEEIQKVADHHNASVSQIATAWAMAKGTMPIIGVTKPNHVEDVVSAGNIQLSDEEMLYLESIAEDCKIPVIREWEKSMTE